MIITRDLKLPIHRTMILLQCLQTCVMVVVLTPFLLLTVLWPLTESGSRLLVCRLGVW